MCAFWLTSSSLLNTASLRAYKERKSRKTPYSLPDVQQFQGIEQDPPLHIIINLLVGPKTRSSIDLKKKYKSVLFAGIAFLFFLTIPKKR